MGMFESKVTFEQLWRKDMTWNKTFKIIGLSADDVQILVKVLCSISTSAELKGYLLTTDFFSFVHIDDSEFNRKLMHSVKPGEMDLCECIVNMWSLCSISEIDLALLLFDFYDKEGNGTVSKDILHVMIQDLYGKHYDHNKQARLVEQKLNEINHFIFTEEIFRVFCHHNYAMIYPAFVLQQLISEKCGGKSFWKRLTKKREERFGTDYVPISLIFEKGGYLPDIKLSAENKRIQRQSCNEHIKEFENSLKLIGKEENMSHVYVNKPKTLEQIHQDNLEHNKREVSFILKMFSTVNVMKRISHNSQSEAQHQLEMLHQSEKHRTHDSHSPTKHDSQYHYQDQSPSHRSPAQSNHRPSEKHVSSTKSAEKQKQQHSPIQKVKITPFEV